MRVLFLFFIVFATAFSFGQTEGYKKMLSNYYSDFPTISIKEAYHQSINRQALFLDVREKDEFNISHIKNAIQISPNANEFKQLDSVAKDQPIIVYCSIGARSQDIGIKLKSLGYTNVTNLYGGLFNWVNHSYPMVDKDSKRTTKIHGYSESWGKWITKGEIVY